MSTIPWRMKMQAKHAISRPRLTAVRWCTVCGAKHKGPCDLVSMYSEPGKPPRHARASIADAIE